MMSDFPIIRNAPPPPEHNGRGRNGRGRKCPHTGIRYPWGELRVGDAFDVPITSMAQSDARYPEYNRLSALASRRNSQPAGPRFVVRILPDEFKVRVWRTA